ncbi:MAG TPA: DUF3426 domain-containing protein [Burkholderiales bacterium]|nr:DUF3426 domain-containing protein [Burkholderiales bacterium]
MSLVTRCPACATAFRVQPAQLAAHAGSVRCGKCSTVFNGVAALVTDVPEPLALEPSPQLGLFDPGRRLPEQPLQADELPPFLAAPPEPPPRRVAWALAAFLAALLLVAQAGYRYRTEIAVLVPEARASLEAACRPLGCSVPLPRRAELMSIDSSDLQADPRRDGVIVLNALLRNRARYTQQFPALELTLTDEADRPVLRRVLRPADYVERSRATQGIPAGAEAQLRVYLDASRARATGYRLYLFYPA